ncbi:MAG TPA: type II toxin-antitoxin system Phd/YefM family antitoxin [Actinocrinis sp.]|nr:type II toxin-antitoxin system Phd/YefM family antitoxin [Actinocrinis sp.]
MTNVTITEARASLGALVRTAAATHEPVYLTDHGHPIAAIVHPEAIIELQEALAYERYLRKKAEGALVTHSMDEVRETLGIPR